MTDESALTTERFAYLGAGWSAAINSMEFYACLACGALLDKRTLNRHQEWHDAAPIDGDESG
jgi:hypothetical protein